MLKVFAFLQNFVVAPVRRDDRGVTAVEYALLLTMLAVVMGTGIIFFGNALITAFKGFVTNF